MLSFEKNFILGCTQIFGCGKCLDSRQWPSVKEDNTIVLY